MKKTYLRAAVLAGFFAGTVITGAQGGAGAGGAGGGGGSAGAGAGAAGGTAAAGAASGSGAASGRAAGGGLNTVGGSSIAGPSGRSIGNASALQANPNTVGGTVNSGGITASPPAASPAATLPTGVASGAQPVQFNTLPTPVQGTLQGFSANGALGSVTAVPGRAGTFRATVTQNGVPTEFILGANGQVLSRAPITGSAAATAGGLVSTDAAALGNLQAGIPLTSLPPGLQSSIQSQLGGAQVQTISRDDFANGSVLRVTALQNGVPTEMRFAANGTLLGSTTVTGAGTSAFNAGSAFNGGSGVVPGGSGGAVLMNDLPNSVQTAVRGQLGELEASRIMQQRTASGMSYMVSYDQNGRPMTMMVGPDGRILSNGPANIGAASARANAMASSNTETNGATRRTAMKLDDLPDKVENVLKQSAPYAEVRTISREQRVGGDVYVVAVRDGDRAGEITIGADGRIIDDSRRDLSNLTARVPINVEEKPEGMPYETLPVAIKNSIKAYASASDIRSVTLGLDRDGRTIYDVIFYRDGRRDRMIIRKDGMLARIEENVSSALEVGSKKPAVIAVGDLPQEVQDTVRRQTDNVLIKEIGTREVGNQTVYQVKYNTNGAPIELLVDKEGAIILPEGEASSDDANAPIQAGVDRAEDEVVKVIDATPGTTRALNEVTRDSGVSATRETGSSLNATASNTALPATSSINLKDTPAAVQSTAKKIAGSATIESISPKIGAGGVMYQVNIMENGRNKTVTLDREGVVQKDTLKP